jgi:hypothetical protein
MIPPISTTFSRYCWTMEKPVRAFWRLISLLEEAAEEVVTTRRCILKSTSVGTRTVFSISTPFGPLML